MCGSNTECIVVRCLSLVVMLALVAGASAFSTPSLLVKRQQNARPLLRCKGGVAAASMLDDSNKGGVWAGFKQWVAESRAGKYDAEKIGARIDETIQGSLFVQCRTSQHLKRMSV